MKFKYLPHTAEMEFVAYGKDLKELIENAASALLNVMLDIKKIKRAEGQTKSMTIRESAATEVDLVLYTLQDILSKVDEKALSAYEFKVEKIIKAGGKRIALVGSLIHKKTSKDLSMLEVKAVTQYGLSIKKGKRWSAKVVLDV